MKTTSNDIYIKILKYANDNPGFRYQEITDAFPDQVAIINEEIKFRKQILIHSSDTDLDKYVLTFEGRIYLLEYEELNEARKSSRNAMIFAIISIIFSSIMNILF
jgi:hypothetical protein